LKASIRHRESASYRKIFHKRRFILPIVSDFSLAQPVFPLGFRVSKAAERAHKNHAISVHTADCIAAVGSWREMWSGSSVFQFELFGDIRSFTAF
jgi:hypothetical protein